MSVTVTPANMSFIPGPPATPSQTLTVTTKSGANWTASVSGLLKLVTISTTQGTGPGTITVSLATGINWQIGTYACNVLVNSQRHTAKCKITITVSAPTFTLSTQAMTFAKTVGQSNPPSQTVTITVPSGTTWTLNQSALTMATITPVSGTGPGTLTVAPDATMTAAAAGTYNESFSVTSKSVTLTVTVATTVTAATTGLLTWPTNFTYLGAFRLPAGTFGVSSFDYAGGDNMLGMAYNPAGNSGAGSLFIVGHQDQQATAEVTIPALVIPTGTVTPLNTASVLQNFVSLVGRVPDVSDFVGQGRYVVGGLAVIGGKLYGSAFIYYDANGDVTYSHFKLDGLTLASSTMTGLFKLTCSATDFKNAGMVAGWIVPVPAAWQATFGSHDAMSGAGAISIIGRTSWGPAAFTFTLSALSSSTPATALFYYPQEHPDLNGLLSGPRTPASDLFNGTTYLGGCFWEGDSILFFGSNGIGTLTGYGEAIAFSDTNRVSKGYHSQGGVYTYEIWAYDANQIAGAANPWDVRPYAHWFFDLPIVEGFTVLSGVAYDSVHRKLYLAQTGADEVDNGGTTYSFKPVIHVYQVSGP